MVCFQLKYFFFKCRSHTNLYACWIQQLQEYSLKQNKKRYIKLPSFSFPLQSHSPSCSKRLLFGAGSCYVFNSAYTSIYSILDPFSPPPHTHIQLSSSLPCSPPPRQLSLLLLIEHEQHTANSSQEFNRYFPEELNKILCLFIHSSSIY